MSDYFSDYSIAYCIWKIKLPAKLIKIRQYQKMNIDLLISDLMPINWDRYQLIPDVQNAWDFLYSELNEVID